MPLDMTQPIGRSTIQAVLSNAPNGSRQKTTMQPILKSSRYVSMSRTISAPHAKMPTPAMSSRTITGRLLSVLRQPLASAVALSMTMKAVVKECVPKLLGRRISVMSYPPELSTPDAMTPSWLKPPAIDSVIGTHSYAMNRIADRKIMRLSPCAATGLSDSAHCKPIQLIVMTMKNRHRYSSGV